MHIDFHHAATYVLARLAGFPKPEAEIISYSSQYIDDATNGGFITFDNEAKYFRIASAHKMLDYKNMNDLNNSRVWLPFHFLPGNDHKKAEEKPDSAYFIDKLVCRPNSYVAQDMLQAAYNDKDKPYFLHRLGVSMHVFGDTWAHQGFAGVINEVNVANDIHINNQPDANILNWLKNRFINGISPLGHGGVLTYPDLPFLKWSYTNGYGVKIERDNPKDYLEASNHIYSFLKNVKEQKDPFIYNPLPSDQELVFKRIISENDSEEGEERHQYWLDQIKQGVFSFGPESLEYIPKGLGSWKHTALKTTNTKDLENEIFPYDSSFLSSDWKLFHDAVQAHRFDVLHDILPKYGICSG